MEPGAFWRQTPRTFAIIMEGRARAAQHRYEMVLSQAWHTEAFARQKKLKPLEKYLTAAEPQKSQTPAEMLATLRELKERGAPMTFTRVEGSC